MRRTWLALGLASGFVVLCLLGAEVYLRTTATHIVKPHAQPFLSYFSESHADFLVKYTAAGRRLVPSTKVVILNHFLSGRDIEVTTNSHGFRDVEMPTEKPPGETRVLVLGDSTTFGDYVAAEEVYVERAEQSLSRSARVQVINAGVGDIGIREEVAILREQGLAVHPDVVVLSFYLNDSRPPWGFPGELGERGWLRRHSLLAETIHRRLKLRQWIHERGIPREQWRDAARTNNWPQDPEAFRKVVAAASHDWGAAWDEASWSVVAEQMDVLAGLAAEHGFRVVVMALPVIFQVEAEHLQDAPQRSLERLAAERGFAYLDLLPVLRQHRGEPLFFDHCHPGVEANRLIGEALADFLRSTASVAPAPPP